MPASSSIRKGLVGLCVLCAALSAQSARILDDTVARPEGARKYFLAVPGHPVEGKLPLVIMLHGHGMSGGTMVHGKTGLVSFRDPALAWLTIVDREGILYMAPEGWKGSDGKRGWNDCRSDAPTNPGTDDVGLLSALIDRAVASHDADPDRVYVIGISNGGAMAYRAAIELAPRLAAVSVLSALMPAHSQCKEPTIPMSVLVTHGTDDPIAPYDGGEISHWLLRDRGTGLGVEESVRIWRELAHLPLAPDVDTIPHRDPDDMTTVTSYLWGSAPAGLQVKLLKVVHGGHVQPSIEYRLPWIVRAMTGRQNGDIEFAEVAWAFFKDKRVGAPAGE